MAQAAKALGRKLLLLGQCVPSVKQNACKIKVKTLEFDPNLNMFFSRFDYIYAHDQENVCKTGDMVLVREMPRKLTTLITHEVMKVVYPLGDVTDPVTNKKTVFVHYRDDQEDIVSTYGPRKGRFEYDKAPPRGWQEDQKDFTHKESYVKYHDDGTEQKYAI